MTNAANVEKLMKDLKVLSRDAEAILHATAGQAGDKLVIESSADLTGWSSISTPAPLNSATYRFTDPNPASDAHRFYRIRRVP